MSRPMEGADVAGEKRDEAKSKPKGTVYRSATTGRFVKRSADRDPVAQAREIRGRFRAQGRRFSDSADIVREDRDAG